MPEIASNKVFYDAMWKEWNDMILYSPAPRLRRSRIISWAKVLPGTSLIDVGCGNGEFLLQVHMAMPHMNLAGADISPAVIAANRSRLPGSSFHVFDLNKERFPERFDIVTCMEVIEHCDDYCDAIAKLAEMTNKWLFITVPCGPLFEIDRRVGHVRHFTAEEISHALEYSGLKVLKLQRWGFPFFNLYKHVINLWPDLICESFLSDRKYTLRHKLLASATYAAFKLSLPLGGYQLFAVASR